MAAHYPEPRDKEAFIRAQIYKPNYYTYEPELYDWPAKDTVPKFNLDEKEIFGEDYKKKRH